MIERLILALERRDLPELRAMGLDAYHSAEGVDGLEVHTPDQAVVILWREDEALHATVTPRRGPWPPDLHGIEFIAQEILDRLHPCA